MPRRSLIGGKKLRQQKIRWIVGTTCLLGILFLMGIYQILRINHSDFNSDFIPKFVSYFTKQQPVDIISRKKVTLKRIPASQIAFHSHKIRGPLRLVLNLLDSDQEIVKGSPFTLEATVISSRYLKKVTLKWVLPDGVTFLQGEQETVINKINKNESRKVSVTLLSHKDINQQIHVQARAHDSGISFGEVAQFNTTDQERINTETLELLQRSERQMKKGIRKQKKPRIFY